ncbi:MAG: glutaminase, partial [Microbacterium sp.]
ARARAAERAAAVRGGFRAGEVVHVGWRLVDLDAVERGEASGPLQLVDGAPTVRWSAAGGLMPLDAYLRERVGLLLDPPPGA